MEVGMVVEVVMEVVMEVEMVVGMEEVVAEEEVIQVEAQTAVALEVGTPAGRCMEQQITSQRPENIDPSTNQATDLHLNRK
jgi:hypothetical protein